MDKRMIDNLICPYCTKGQMCETRLYHYWSCNNCDFECSSKTLKLIYQDEINAKEVKERGLGFGIMLGRVLFSILTIDFSQPDTRIDMAIVENTSKQTKAIPDLSKLNPGEVKNVHLVNRDWLKKTGYKYYDKPQEIKFA
jgi:hypothetical protein